VRRCGLDSAGSEYGSVEGSYGNGNERSNSIKGGDRTFELIQDPN